MRISATLNGIYGVYKDREGPSLMYASMVSDQDIHFPFIEWLDTV